MELQITTLLPRVQPGLLLMPVRVETLGKMENGKKNLQENIYKKNIPLAVALYTILITRP